MEEGTTDSKCASARDGLRDDDAVESAGTGTVCEEGGGFGEFGHSCDTGVFFVQFGGHDFVFGGSDGGEDVGFALVVAVGSDS